MESWPQRIVIYTALALLCALTASVVGSAAGALSFVQVVAVIEFIGWLARPASSSDRAEG